MTCSRHLTRSARLVGATVLLTVSSAVSAFDVDPGDYQALPPGANLAILYAGYLGNTDDDFGDFDASINIARVVFYRKWLGITVDPQILLPFGAQNLNLGDGVELDTAGVGDPILATTFWVVNNDKWQVGLTPFLTLPIGSYDKDDALNFGENRFTFTPQIGVIYRPTAKVALQQTLDVTFRSDNDEFGPDSLTLEQDASFQSNSLASYTFNDKFTLGGRYAYKRLGEQRIAGERIADDASTHQLSAYAQYFPVPTVQLQLRLSRDLDNEGALGETQNVELRILKVF